jgi:protein-tyrosine phosphatase
VAHPERYRNLEDLELVEEWRTVGCYIQVNAGSVIGRYGDRAAKMAAELMRRGWIDYLCSDYHARGRVAVAECRERLLRNGGEVQARLLMEENPGRMLDNQEPEPVPSLDPDQPFWRRLLRLG